MTSAWLISKHLNKKISFHTFKEYLSGPNIVPNVRVNVIAVQKSNGYLLSCIESKVFQNNVLTGFHGKYVLLYIHI